MNNAQEMLMGRRGRNVVGAAIAASMLVLHACAKTHGPQDSTETGNPPVIDAERVALRVQDGEPHVVGEKGAVKPGGVTITVRNLVSDKRASEQAAKDGSFDVKAPGSANDGFWLQASNEDAESKPVFVTKTRAVEGDGKSGALSCEQQTMLSDVQTRAASMTADTTCTQDEDCVEVETSTVCWDTCETIAVSSAGKMQIEAVVSSINEGLCHGYEPAGCTTGIRFCPADPLPHPLACVQGQCKRVDGADAGVRDAGNDGGASSCSERSDTALAQLQQATADADRSCSGDADCTLAPVDTDCFGGCPFDVVSATGAMQVQNAIMAINTGVCAGFTADGCGVSIPDCGSAPTPICKQGRCAGDMTCDTRSNQASAQLQQAIANADTSCSTNADCVTAPSATDCFAGCSTQAISRTGEAQVQAAVTAINAGVCSGFDADGCTLIVPPCVPPPMPLCVQGQCSPVIL